jgi:hypothetical protein
MSMIKIMIKQKLHNFKNYLKEGWSNLKSNPKGWLKRQVVKIGVAIGAITLVALAAGNGEPLPIYQVVEWERPTTTEAWAEDVKKDNLDIKFDYQLDQMEENLTEKLPRVQQDLDKFIQCPDCIKWELKEGLNEEFSGQKLTDAVEEEYQSQLAYYKWKADKLNQSLERIKKEKELRYEDLVIRTPEGTTYYIDCINGTDTSIGTATSTAGLDLDQFTEVARSAGDKVIVRRGGTGCDNGSDLLFTSDGTINNPITIEADYDNAWGDFASSSQTYTVTFGSKTMTASAEITDILANDWIYVDGDDQRDYAYEVESIGGAGTTTLTLYLPYKGGQSGAGNGLEIMPDAPIWNTATGNFEWNFDNDNYWKVQGIDIRGTDSLGNVEIDSSYSHQFIDCIFIGNGSSDYGIKCGDDRYVVRVDKSRFFNHEGNIEANISDAYGLLQVYNVLLDGNDVSLSSGISAGTFNFIILEGGDIEGKNHIAGYGDIELEVYGTRSYIRGTNLQSPYEVNTLAESKIGIEDYNLTPGKNVFTSLSTEEVGSNFPIQSETSIVRSGGGATSIKVSPTTRMDTDWNFSRVQLFEYPIYADTSSKQYDVYFHSPATNTWTADPTASELWIECEYWGHATNNFRKITKSTGVLDFNGTTTWNALSVTCQPSQTGVLYLRGWYAKTKEAGSNIFYVDVAPVIQ